MTEKGRAGKDACQFRRTINFSDALGVREFGAFKQSFVVLTFSRPG